MIRANYTSFIPGAMKQFELNKHAYLMARYDVDDIGIIDNHRPPDGFKKYHTVDVIGSEFVWMNKMFPKEKYTWYLWFESVFLVPDEMLPFLALRWS